MGALEKWKKSPGNNPCSSGGVPECGIYVLECAACVQCPAEKKYSTVKIYYVNIIDKAQNLVVTATGMKNKCVFVFSASCFSPRVSTHGQNIYNPKLLPSLSFSFSTVPASAEIFQGGSFALCKLESY